MPKSTLLPYVIALSGMSALIPTGVAASPFVTLDRSECEEAMLGRPKLFGPEAAPWLRRAQVRVVGRLARIERGLEDFSLAVADAHAGHVDRFRAALRNGFGLNELLAPGPRTLDEAWLRAYFAGLESLTEQLVLRANALGAHVHVSEQAIRFGGDLIEPNGAVVAMVDKDGGIDFVTPLGRLRLIEENLDTQHFGMTKALIDFGMRAIEWSSSDPADLGKVVYIFGRDLAGQRLPAATRISPDEARPAYADQLARWAAVKPASRELKYEPPVGEAKAGTGSAPVIKL